jgi:hypothetical protein
MHLSGFPHTYVKDGHEPRLVCYTVEARELRADGWVRAEKPAAPAPAPAEVTPEPASVASVTEIAKAEETDFQAEPVIGDVDFDALTKRELLQYAQDRGVDLPDNALKADIVKACKAL